MDLSRQWPKAALGEISNVSNGPRFVETVTDIVGLYLNQSEHALVLSCDDKSQIQKPYRTQKRLLLYRNRLGTLTHDEHGHVVERPDIRSDNGSVCICREFAGVLDEHGLSHRRIKPHCPEENGLLERAQRTLGKLWDQAELKHYHEAVRVIDRVIPWYNQKRLHSALGFLRPVDYYRGAPAALHEARRRKLAEARHRRTEKNLGLRQLNLPLERCQSFQSQSVP